MAGGLKGPARRRRSRPAGPQSAAAKSPHNRARASRPTIHAPLHTHRDMTRRLTPGRLILTLGALALLAVVAVGLAQLAGRRSPTSSTTASTAGLTRAETAALLAGSPPALAALHAQAGEVLGGGAKALDARLASLKGYPIVINKWASWCVPCREEFGALAHASARFGRRVAFIGLDSGDPSRADAVAFLRAHPVSYPSWYDKSGVLGERITDSSFTPVTVFLARDGKLSYIHQGQYPSLEKLEQDIERYALNA